MKLWVLGPWLVFAATVAAVAVLNGGVAPTRSVVAFAEGVPEGIAPLEAGRLASLAVEPGQDVAEGQVVAWLDTTALDSEIAVVEAQRQQALAQMGAVEAETRREVSLDENKMKQWLYEARVALAREEVALAKARAQEKTLRAERDRLKELVQRRLAPASELSAVEVEYEAAAREAEALPPIIESLRRQLHGAQREPGREGANYWTVLAVPLQRELEVVERQLSWLKQRREGLRLRAPSAGRILQVVKRPGEVVAAGEAVAMLIRQQATRVVACVTEQDAVNVQEGNKAMLWPRGGSGEALSGRAVALGPLVDELPARCRRTPRVPVWGRNVVIQLDQPSHMLPGQAFDVRFMPDEQAPPPHGVAAAALGVTSDSFAGDGVPGAASPGGAEKDRVPAPLVVEVPPALAEKYHLEPSGLAWRADLARYLVVSDDTGYSDDDKHAPVLFTLSMDGRVDPQPTAVSGVDELNDLESIAPAPDGSIYVLSSQSVARSGKRKPSRTAFLKLVPSGTGLRVAGKVHLADLLDGLTAEQLKALGLPGNTRALDVEGMAYWQGALYLGLKGPLDAEGRTAIWRLGSPDVLFAGGKVQDAGLGLWARVKLDAEVDGKPAPGGISELLFLPDGTLVVASTPSQAEGGRQTGRLWVVPEPRAGELTPRLVHDFPGLRPEGLSLSPHPGRLAVVFDEGSGHPKWMELPWPR
ncbi:MAG: HlyD family efflux transporter periplasmic adaptor subunit [Myxococcota bacterium]